MKLAEGGVFPQALSNGLVTHAQQLLSSERFASCDAKFGPWAYGCRHGRFDFTFFFEQTFMAIVPSAIFITLALVRIGQLFGGKPKVRTTTVAYVKLTACSVLIALEMATLLQWIRLRDILPAESTTLAASAATLASASILAVLSNLEHTRAAKPSSLIAFYLVLSTLLDVIRCRTLFLLQALAPLTATFAAGMAAKFIILCLESRNKRSIMIGDWNILGREATSSILNTAFLWWVNPILWRGHTSILKQSVLPALEPQFRSQSLVPVMLRNWERYRHSGKYALIWTLLRTSKSSLIAGAIPRILLSACKLAVPFFIARVIAYVSNDGNDDEDRLEVGYALIMATALLFLTRSLVQLAYDQARTRMRVLMRSALVGTLLHQAAQLEPGEKQGSASLTLTTADAGRGVMAFQSIHEIWITPIEIVLATWLLARQVGWGCVGPLCTVVMAGIVSTLMAKVIGPAQRDWMQAMQERISDTTSVLGSMKETKMLGLVDSCSKALQDLLDNEMVKSIAFRRVLSLLNATGRVTETFSPMITFGIAILFSGGNRLSISEAFTSLSIMGLIYGPMMALSHELPFAIGAIPCFDRMQEFLELCSTYEGEVSLRGASTEATGSTALIPGLEEPLFAITEGNVTVKSKDEPLIAHANLKILPGSFNVVAGKVAAGKSVLLRALMGQLQISGDARVRTSNIAYCAQTPWIITGTAKENIIGESEKDEIWYRTVVTACGLDRDFDDFSQGDAVPVGSKGISLSGGQKSRISLARGVFSRKPIIFVDDVLSGLDWATQRFVWNEVFGPSGLLRKNGITVVLATHALHLVDNPDSVILLGDSGPGSIVQGTMAKLKAESKLGDLISADRGNHDGSDSGASSADGSQKGKETNAPASKTSEEEAELYRKTGDASLYLYYLKAVDSFGLINLVATSVIMGLWPILPQVWLLWWTEANEAEEEPSTAMYFWVYAGLDLGKVVTLFIAVYYALVVFAPKAIRVLYSRLLKTTMSAPLSFFVATPQGDLVNRFSKDIQQIDLELPSSIFTSLVAALGLIRAFALVMLGSVYLAFVVVPMLGFVYFLQKYYLRTSRQLRYLDLQSTAPLNTHLIEVIDGAATIQAFGWQDELRAAGAERLDNSQKPRYLLSVIQNWLGLVMSLFVSLTSVLLIATCVALPQSTSTGGVALSLFNLISLAGSLSFLVTSWTSLETSLGAAERLRTFERTTPKEMPPANPAVLPSLWPHNGEVTLKSLTASYEGQGGAAPLKVLDKVEAEILPGQKVAVCGRTGSGKSSLLLTLFRMLDLDSGSILVDGVNIANVPQNVLRSRLIAVPQEPMLLPGTLRSNLRPARGQHEETSASDDAVLIDCLKAVELWEAVESQGGLDSKISDLKLSHGQKQLVCLARALASKDASSIVILDEAMSAVDKENEELMVKVLEEHFAKHTVISVVHRLNTIEKFDSVLLLDSGVVVEAGSPKALLENKDGRFRALWEGREK